MVSSKTILIVEDETDVVDLLTLNLRKAGGFIVATAADGATGLTKAREENPALIILDLMLPQMPGLEVCKILKTDPATRHIPIMVLTAKVLSPDDKRALNGHVAAIFQRSSVAGPELIDWLHGLAAKKAEP